MAQPLRLAGGFRKIIHATFLIITFLFILTLEVNAESRPSASLGPCFEVFNAWVNPRITPESLALEIMHRRARVPEFQQIRKEGEKRGLRVWLFGGTAASFSHYVKWDVLRELGDSRFQAHRFDYDYTNIYRSTQDLDIVVSGDAQSAQSFEQELKTQFPYFLGSKTAGWEVRSLTEARGDKGGIIGDFGFMNQHTDSNSTGMVELTDPPPGETIVRDIRHWSQSQVPTFLKDVTDGNLTFYFSERHAETPLARSGRNPPIFAVIRALTKAFQYDLKISQQDWALFQQVIQKFDPKKDLSNEETSRWIEKNGKKLFLHAVNIEYAWDTIESLGLRKKLISIQNNSGSIDSLAWWMNKEPLRSKPVGEGSGKTAESLGIQFVAHETHDFFAYESMTRSHLGKPNVFISREGSFGEAASHGDGFYTAIGRKGAKGTGITIRFEVDPKAKEGSDFVIESRKVNGALGEGTFVVWKNKNAIRVISESLEMSPVDYFKFLANGQSVEYEDQALFWKLKRKLDLMIASGRIPVDQMDEIRLIVFNELKNPSIDSQAVVDEWIKIEGARLRKNPLKLKKLMMILRSGSSNVDPGFVFSQMMDLSHQTLLEKFIVEEWLPSFLNLKTVKFDLGYRALENCLFSTDSRIREIGAQVLKEREAKNSNAFVHALKSIYEQGVTPQAWLQSLALTEDQLRQKGAYLALHPEFRSILSEAEWSRIELEFKKFSFIGLFEKLPHPIELNEAKSESFEFQAFDFPTGGRKVLLGSPVDEQGRWPGVEDEYEVILTQSFEMQATPVTQLQWALIMGADHSSIPEGFNRPVESVSWEDVQRFILKLNQLDSEYEYRLPTEAEWEFAARGGVQAAYSFGDDPKELKSYGWFLEHSENQTHDVASLKPNAYELYDMYGNVEEWVYDRWTESRPRNAIDPKGPTSGSLRVLRGGSSQNTAEYLRSASRSNADAAGRSSSIGFRLVRTQKK